MTKPEIKMCDSAWTTPCDNEAYKIYDNMALCGDCLHHYLEEVIINDLEDAND